LTGLQQKLLKSSALKSLNAERKISLFARSLKWDTTHSFYFKDVVTDKTRELDVLALKIWSKRKHLAPLVRVWLLLECKTMNDYSIIFSREDNLKPYLIINYSQWIGDAECRMCVVEESKKFLSKNTAISFMRKFDQLAYPSDFKVVAPADVEPPAAKHNATAYREVKPGVERDLEASVLWKSVQSISSAREGLERHHTNWHTKGLFGMVESHPYAVSEENFLDEVLFWCQDHVLSIDIYHPVIIVSCPLWLWDGRELTTAHHVRLVNRRPGGLSEWYDVVSEDAAVQVLDGLTEHYDVRMGEGFKTLLRRIRSRRSTRRPAAPEADGSGG
jgi:hypothetical protein